MKFYIDGALVKDWDNVPDAAILDISNDPVNLTIGQDLPTSVYSTDDTSPYYVNWGGYFKGKLDDIYIFNRVLSDDEVKALYDLPVSVKEPLAINKNFELYQNYPNPFSTTTTIEFSQKNKGFTTLKVYNILGDEVASLISGEQQEGNYKYTWDANGVSSGMYFYKLTIDGMTQTRKLFLVK
jgi:hypothetical protein